MSDMGKELFTGTARPVYTGYPAGAERTTAAQRHAAVCSRAWLVTRLGRGCDLRAGPAVDREAAH